jgi:type I restriction enzyme, S subunit
MPSEVASSSVAELVRTEALLVEDGNHGEYRPLAHEFSDTGTPFIRPDDLVGGLVRFDGCDRINEVATKRVRKGKGKAGDILFTHRATVGRIARVGPAAPDFVANPGVTVWRVRDSSRIHRDYLYYYMQCPGFMDQVWSMAGGTDTFPYISLTQQRTLHLQLPPLAEQKAVGSTLAALDDRIDLLRRTNATLESIAQVLFKSWFIDFDPVRAKGDGREPEGMDAATAALFPAEFEESALGLIPKGWRVEPIGDLVEPVGGSTPDTKDPAFWKPAVHHWTSPKDLSGATSPVLLDTERKVSPAGLAKISSGLLPAGTLLMSSRAPIGYLTLTQVPVAINQGYIGMPPGGRLTPLYLYFWCQANMDGIKGRANGSTFMEISKRAFRPIPALLPPQHVIDSFGDVAGSLFNRLVANERQACALVKMRDALLPRLISGKLRLPEPEAQLLDAIA